MPQLYIPELGQLALILALLLAVLQVILPLTGVKTGRVWLMNYARPLAVGQALFLCIALMLLTLSFLNDDFSVAYVATNSNTQLPVPYKISAVWGAHEGSLLLWVTMLGLWGVAVAMFSRSLPVDMVARVLGVMGMVSAGFILFTAETSNPFARILPSAPAEGGDLNPLLQDFGLIVHPPTLYMGYVGLSVAFSFAIAALMSGRLDAAWARWSRPWTLAAWIFLTIGIALGSWWAYYELGWGGWWFWDPVENASLMPWLAATALLHSTSVLATRDALRAWTIMLGVVAFSMSMLGTFLVRSGILTSVHAFAVDPQRGTFILFLLAIYIGGALLLFALRAGAVSEGARFSVASREGALVVNNVLLSAILAVVLLGTLYPLLTEAFDVRVSVGPPYFNPVGAIFALPMVAVMAVGPLLRWRRDGFGRIRRELALMGTVLLAALVLVSLIGEVAFLPLLGLALAAMLALASVMPLRGRNLRRVPIATWGMVFGHLGLAVALFGMASESAFTKERLAALAPGEQTTVGPWTVTLDQIAPAAGANWTAMEARLSARLETGDPIILTPQHRTFWAPPQQTAESVLATRWNGQLYAVIGNQAGATGAGPERWQVRLWWKPFVTWIWYGGVLVALGGALALIGHVQADWRRRIVRRKAAARRREMGREMRREMGREQLT